MPKTLRQLKTPLASLVVVLFFVLQTGCSKNVSADISEERARSDLQSVIGMTAGSLTEIGTLEMLGTSSPFEGRLYVDMKVELKANEAAIAESAREQDKMKQLFGSGHRSRTADREAMMVKQAAGSVEKVRLIYKQTGGDLWELENFGSVPSEYSLQHDASGTGPAENQVKQEFAKMIETAAIMSNRSMSLGEFEIQSSDVLEEDRVSLQVVYKIKGDTEGMEADGDTVDVVYKREENGQWEMEAPAK